MTVEKLSERMSFVEFLRWADYDLQKPHSEAWEQTALLCSVVANTFAGKGSKRIKPSDYLPPRAKIGGPPSHILLKGKIGAFAARHNANIRAKGPDPVVVNS